MNKNLLENKESLFIIEELDYNNEKNCETIFELSIKSRIGNTWRAQTTIAHLNEKNLDIDRIRIFVAWKKEEIVGFITFYKPFSENYETYIPEQAFVIWDLYVEEGSRGEGIGTALVSKYFDIEQESAIIVNYPISQGMRRILSKNYKDKTIKLYSNFTYIEYRNNF